MVRQKHTNEHTSRENVGHLERIYSRLQNTRKNFIPPELKYHTVICWHSNKETTTGSCLNES